MLPPACFRTFTSCIKKTTTAIFNWYLPTTKSSIRIHSSCMPPYQNSGKTHNLVFISSVRHQATNTCRASDFYYTCFNKSGKLSPRISRKTSKNWDWKRSKVGNWSWSWSLLTSRSATTCRKMTKQPLWISSRPPSICRWMSWRLSSWRFSRIPLTWQLLWRSWPIKSNCEKINERLNK